VIVWNREIHPVAIVVGGALLGALALWGFDSYRHRGDKTPFEQKADTAKAATTAATLWLPARNNYLAAKQRTAAVPAAREVAVACDSALAAQDRRIVARDTLVGALRRELDVWQNKPGPPRLEAYAEGLYDAVNAVPVARLGASFRVAGPIDAIAQAEYAAPKAGQSNPSFRAVAGIRYRF
jgi:hypothetical protein